MALIPKLRRRVLLVCLIVGMSGLGAWPARALDVEAARAHVDGTIEQILQLIRASLPRAETAKALRAIFAERAALPQLARFTAGRHWSQMSSDEQARFTESFSNYVAFVYAGYFREFEGDIEDLRAVVSIRSAEDAGPKGILVHTEIRPIHQLVISVDWLVSDRSGKIAVSDLAVEGISMAITQREIILAMLQARRGDVDMLIADMKAQQAKTQP